MPPKKKAAPKKTSSSSYSDYEEYLKQKAKDEEEKKYLADKKKREAAEKAKKQKEEKERKAYEKYQADKKKKEAAARAKTPPKYETESEYRERKAREEAEAREKRYQAEKKKQEAAEKAQRQKEEKEREKANRHAPAPPKYSPINSEVGTSSLANVRSNDLNKCSYIMKEVLDAYRNIQAREARLTELEKARKIEEIAPPRRIQPAVVDNLYKWTSPYDVPPQFRDTDTLSIGYLDRFGGIEKDIDPDYNNLKYMSKFIPHGSTAIVKFYPKINQFSESYPFGIYFSQTDAPTAVLPLTSTISDLARQSGFIEVPNIGLTCELNANNTTLLVRGGVLKGMVVNKVIFLSMSAPYEAPPVPITLAAQYGGRHRKDIRICKL